MFEAQREVARELGFYTSLLSYEDLQQEDRLVVRPPALPKETLVLRGRMLPGWLILPGPADRILLTGPCTLLSWISALF